MQEANHTGVIACVVRPCLRIYRAEAVAVQCCAEDHPGGEGRFGAWECNFKADLRGPPSVPLHAAEGNANRQWRGGARKSRFGYRVSQNWCIGGSRPDCDVMEIRGHLPVCCLRGAYATPYRPPCCRPTIITCKPEPGWGCPVRGR